MNTIVLTQYSNFLLGPIAKILGYIMDGIFNILDFLTIPNVGLSIILFTIVIYLLMLPLTIKQQKFSKLSAKINPEIQAIQAKYKNRKDNDSAMQMNAETQAVYAKYGVSPTGSCLQLLIQMPILLSLYRVINAMPAYVGKIKEAFMPLVDKLIATEGGTAFIQNTENFKNAAMYTKQFSNELFMNGNTEYVQNTLIDVLNKASTSEFTSIATQFPDLASDVAETVETLGKYNEFVWLNMGNSPSYMVNEAIAAGAWLMVVAAFAIPVLSAVTQWINVKLMPQQEANPNASDQASTMASSMKTMNMFMPIMSAFFCYTMPAGMGLYWIAGSVVRSIQQVIINKHIDKIDLNEVIEKNKTKSSKKMAKMEEKQKKYAEYAALSTKNINTRDIYTKKVQEAAEKSSTVETNSTSTSVKAKSGSLLEKANMVRDYNERNNK